MWPSLDGIKPPNKLTVRATLRAKMLYQNPATAPTRAATSGCAGAAHDDVLASTDSPHVIDGEQMRTQKFATLVEIDRTPRGARLE